MTNEEHKERRKIKDRERAQRRRRALDAKPRAEYEANSLSQIKPWLTAGVSRATWYRRQRETISSSIKLLYY